MRKNIRVRELEQRCSIACRDDASSKGYQRHQACNSRRDHVGDIPSVCTIETIEDVGAEAS